MPLIDGWQLQSPGDETIEHASVASADPISYRPAWRIDKPGLVEEYFDCSFTFGHHRPDEPSKDARPSVELAKSLGVLSITFVVALLLSEFAVRDQRFAAALAVALLLAIVLLYQRRVRRRALQERR